MIAISRTLPRVFVGAEAALDYIEDNFEQNQSEYATLHRRMFHWILRPGAAVDTFADILRGKHGRRIVVNGTVCDPSCFPKMVQQMINSADLTRDMVVFAAYDRGTLPYRPVGYRVLIFPHARQILTLLVTRIIDVVTLRRNLDNIEALLALRLQDRR